MSSMFFDRFEATLAGTLLASLYFAAIVHLYPSLFYPFRVLVGWVSFYSLYTMYDSKTLETIFNRVGLTLCGPSYHFVTQVCHNNTRPDASHSVSALYNYQIDFKFTDLFFFVSSYIFFLASFTASQMFLNIYPGLVLAASDGTHGLCCLLFISIRHH